MGISSGNHNAQKTSIFDSRNTRLPSSRRTKVRLGSDEKLGFTLGKYSFLPMQLPKGFPAMT
jgi:hypothetical protein